MTPIVLLVESTCHEERSALRRKTCRSTDLHVFITCQPRAGNTYIAFRWISDAAIASFLI